MNRPKEIDWKITLSSEDKAPFGGYILYHQLKDLFPNAAINSYRSPVYNQLNNFNETGTAYILIAEQLQFSGEDVEELLDYVVSGNYVFLAASGFSKALTDSLRFKTARRFDMIKDSITINLTNPQLHADNNYGFKPMTVDGYINKVDSAAHVALGNNQLNDINFIRMSYGDGAFFIHAMPLCFSNYFMLTVPNADYTAKVLSYLPKTTKTIFWDEYYKLGASGSQNPLRFILNNTWLRWAFRVGLATMLLFVLFGMKRKQRVIPVIPPLENSTVNFVKTVGNSYFNQHDNKNIALKKISYFLEYVRSNLFLSTNNLDDEFTRLFSNKTGISEEEVSKLTNLIGHIQEVPQVEDQVLLELNRRIDNFYEGFKR
jgi:hypothetical protein